MSIFEKATAKLGLTQPVEFEERRVTTLWAGYGCVNEVIVTHTTTAGEKASVRLMLKRVSPPANKDGESHRRKVKSYDVEADFYRKIAPDLVARGIAVPRPIVVNTGDHLELLMTDLRVTHPRSFTSGGFEESSAALTLLAQIHAMYWEISLPGGLWPEGSYWHLQTRLGELAGIRDERVRRSARALDRRLRGLDSNGEVISAARRTLVHGDPKGANLLLSLPGDHSGVQGSQLSAAAYDFQYTGGGLGARDVAHILTAAVDEETLDEKEDELLECYHNALVTALRLRGDPEGEAAANKCRLETLRDEVELTAADYHRFLHGWGMWGNCEWVARKAEKCLDRLDGGQLLDSEEAYDVAVAREYPYPD